MSGSSFFFFFSPSVAHFEIILRSYAVAVVVPLFSLTLFNQHLELHQSRLKITSTWHGGKCVNPLNPLSNSNHQEYFEFALKMCLNYPVCRLQGKKENTEGFEWTTVSLCLCEVVERTLLYLLVSRPHTPNRYHPHHIHPQHPDGPNRLVKG